MIDFLKQTLRPSQITCILALLTPGVLLLFVPPLARWGRRWLAIVALFYWTLSTPAGAGLSSGVEQQAFEFSDIFAPFTTKP